MTTFKTGDGTQDAVLFVTLSMVVPEWFRIAFMGALREMTVQENWFVEGDATADFARDKSVEMIDSIQFSEENPLPINTPLIGSLLMYGSATIPAKWMSCHGQSLVKTEYAELFDVLGDKFGSIDGTHFNLPDFRDMFPVGANPILSNAGIGLSGGLASVTLTVPQIPEHAHNGVVSPNNPVSNRAVVSTGGIQTVKTAGTSDNAGGGEAHENRPPFLGIEMIIYTGVE